MSRYIRCLALFGGLATLLCLLITASAQATHPRPKAATPIYMPLVPAYAACAAPNRQHGPPLAFASCNPPAQTSAQATVGTPDAFGGAANSVSHLRLSAWRSIPGGPEEGDILIDLALNDLRCVPTMRCGAANAAGPADYSGELRFSFTFRLTDHWNATVPGGGTDPATVQDFVMVEHSWACVESGSTSTGSTCNLNTSVNTLIPGGGRGAVLATKRETWELDAVRIYDGGADGDGDTTGDNTVFARPGVFIP
jgi:hypothetical protein